MPDELSELQENAEHGRENPSLAPISVTMAILAVCVAVVSLMGHRSHTEELLMQNRATDQWAYYQAENIRRHNYDMGSGHAFSDGIQGQGTGRKGPGKIQRASRPLYQGAGGNRGARPRTSKAESARAQRKADRFDLGEVFLEIALVISSLALLSRKLIFWFLGIAVRCSPGLVSQ